MAAAIVRLCGALICASASTSAWAVPMTMELRGLVSGQLNAEPFSLRPYVFTLQVDTSNLLSGSPEPEDGQYRYESFVNPPLLEVEGLPPVELLTSIRISLYPFPFSGEINMRDLDADQYIFRNFVAGELYPWRMDTPVGPIVGAGDGAGWGGVLQTSGGPISLEGGLQPTTFEAFFVPEPATATLLCLAGLLLSAVRRR